MALLDVPGEVGVVVERADAEVVEAVGAALERALPPGAAAGDRYPEAQMSVLDSERG